MAYPSVRLPDALKALAELHHSQRDKANRPYILHPIAVAELAARDIVEPFEHDFVYGVALLHDAIEDGPPWARLRVRDALGDRGLDAVEKLTHRDGESYQAYIDGLDQDPVARRVKLADLTHNMDPRRIPDPDTSNTAKYRAAYVRLSTGAWPRNA